MRTSRFVTVCMIGMACIATAAIPTHAVSQLDFGIIAPTGGVISFSGQAGDPLVGIDIEVDQVVGLGTPANAGTPVTIIDGLINFDTGGSSTQPGDGFWSFNPGGEITVTGAVPSVGISDPDTVLLNGNFQMALVVPAGLVFRVAVAEFLDFQNSTLTDHFGLPGGPDNEFQGHMNLSFLSFGSTDAGALEDGFESFVVLSGGIENTPVENTVVIPAPASAWAGATVMGLIAAVGFRRMRLASWAA